jgi:hypothetical protein
MSQRKNLFLIAALVVGAAGPSVRADFIIPQWRLGVSVYDSSSGEDDTSIFATVQNPFQDSHSATAGISTAETTYDFAWSADFGSFLIDAAHEAEDVDPGFLLVRSSGFIWVAPSIDLSLEISAAYSYYLPPHMMMAELKVVVFDEDTSERLFYSLQRDNSFDGYPVSGTFTVDGNATLPAGHTTFLYYRMSIVSFSSQPPGLLATGTGSVSFTLQPVPEPSTLALLAPLVLIVPRRRHHRS